METAAAILVQIIINSNPTLSGQLREQAGQGAQQAVDFLRPYYVAARKAIANQENRV